MISPFLILLAVYLVFSGLADFLGFNLGSMASFLLGLTAVGSGVLMLLSVKECMHCSEEE